MGASAGLVTLADGVDQDFFEDEDGATSIFVRCTSGTALITIPGLHVPGDYVSIPSGDEIEFRLNHMGIKMATGKGGLSAAADIEFGVISKTVNV